MWAYNLVAGTHQVLMVLSILGCVPYAIWVIWSAIRKRWRRVRFQIIIPALFYPCLWLLTPTLLEWSKSLYHAGLFDAEVNLEREIFKHEPKRGFNGDGYSITVHELPASVRHRFETADARLLGEYPGRPFYRSDWVTEHWRKSPYETRFEDAVHFAVRDAPSPYREALEKALAREGTYYAFFHNSRSGGVADIDFFVVDLVDGRIYLINSNT